MIDETSGEFDSVKSCMGGIVDELMRKANEFSGAANALAAYAKCKLDAALECEKDVRQLSEAKHKQREQLKERLERERLERERLERERLERERLENLRWEFSGNAQQLSRTSYQTTQAPGWVASSTLSGNFSIRIHIAKGNKNGWFQLGLDSPNVTVAFKGNYTENAHPFSYNAYGGTINGQSGFKHNQNKDTTCDLIVNGTQMQLLVDNASLGTFTIPSPFRILLDIYHPTTTATITVQKR
jgi:hypothetical protein